MEWQLTDDGCYAYKINENTILITDQLTYSFEDDETPIVDVDENSPLVERFKVLPNGNISFVKNHWRELINFNRFGGLLDQVIILNEVLYEHFNHDLLELDIDDVLKEESIFSINRQDYNQLVKLDDETLIEIDSGFDFRIGPNIYRGRSDFIDGTFLDPSLMNREWSLSELTNLVVHLQKFLCEVEIKGNSNCFVNIDYDLLVKFKGEE